MLRKLALAGLVAGGSAMVPALHQANPALFEGAVTSVFGRDAPQPAPPVIVGEARVKPAREPLSGRKARIAADGRGHFSGEFRLNGRAVDALVDTGATVVAINVSTARRLGLSPSALQFTQSIHTANGTIRGAPAQLDSVQIGRIAIRDVPAMVLEDRALSGTLVGMSFLNRLASFRIEGGTLVMEQ